MDAMFRHIRPAELLTSRNGLVLSMARPLSGHLIVPDLPERPTRSMRFSLGRACSTRLQIGPIRVLPLLLPDTAVELEDAPAVDQSDGTPGGGA
jgi:hypothetical protein